MLGEAEGVALMMLAGRDDIRVTEADEEILVFDVSDDVLERAAPIIGGEPP